MSGIHLTSTILLLHLLLVTDVTSQFFDFFGFQPLVQQFQQPRQRTQYEHVQTESTTKRPSRKHSTRKTTTVSYGLHYPDRDDNIRHISKEEKRRKTTLRPIDISFNLYTTTVKPSRKPTERPHSRPTGQRNRNKNTSNTVHTTKNNIYYDDSNVEVTTKGYTETGNKKNKQRITSDSNYIYYEKPLSSNIADEYYNYTTRYHLETVTKSVYTYNEDDRNDNANQNRNKDNNFYGADYNNNNNNDNQRYTTKKYQLTDYNNDNRDNNNNRNTNNQRYTTKNPLHRPGVRPAVEENRPPITNRPIRPVTNRPITKKPVAVFPRPTDAGSIAFPDDDDGPEIITGPDEDYMSDVEKRRYIDIAEKMCDKYKSLNTKQLQAIPLIPSPEPVQVNVSSCAPTNVPLVVGGKVVTINEFPHMALLGWTKVLNGGYSWKCGGSLISDQYVLTAAHCAYQERDNTVITGAPRVVQLGSSYLDDPGALVVRIAAVIRHPKYKSPRSYYDIALVKLARPVMFSEVIRPACIGEPPPVGQPIIATGWGQTKFAGDQSLELRSVSLPVWDMASCAAILDTSRRLPNGPMSDSQMCAGDRRGGKDTCQGDSGGPAQLQEGCVWRVVAVTSLGRSCGAPNTPGLYAKVQRAFIAAQVFGGHRNGNTNINGNRNNNGQSVQNGASNVNRQDQNNGYNANNNYDNGRGVVYNYNNKDKTNDDQYYNNPQTHTTEYTRRFDQNSFGNSYNTNNNNRYNRQETTESTNKEANNGNYHINNHDENHRDVNIHDTSRNTNQQQDYNKRQPFNYDSNSYNQDQTATNYSPQNYDSGSYNTQVDNSNNHRHQDKNNNQDYNKQQRSDDDRFYFGGPTWWTR